MKVFEVTTRDHHDPILVEASDYTEEGSFINFHNHQGRLLASFNKMPITSIVMLGESMQPTTNRKPITVEVGGYKYLAYE